MKRVGVPLLELRDIENVPLVDDGDLPAVELSFVVLKERKYLGF